MVSPRRRQLSISSDERRLKSLGRAKAGTAEDPPTKGTLTVADQVRLRWHCGQYSMYYLTS